MMAVERFARVSEEEIQQILDDKDSKNTKKCTKYGMNAFEAYLKAKNIDMPNKINLNQVLQRFWIEARQKDGQHYKKTTLQSIRYGLQRHFMKEKGFDITGEEFKKSEDTFKAMMVQLKKIGKGTIVHKKEIERNDLLSIYEYFVGAIDNPIGLQEKVFFDLLYHICRRGRENITMLTKHHFSISLNSENNRRYVYQCIDELDKNHKQNEENANGAHMYEVKGSDTCPVTSFKKYISKLNPKNDRLFQRPKSHVDESDPVWYLNMPIGHTTIGNMVPSICTKAGVTNKYTNHCVRATCIGVLDDNNYASRHIMSVSGHRSECTLKNYSNNRQTKNKKKEEMSSTLSGALGLSTQIATCSTSVPSSTATELSNQVHLSEDRQIVRIASPLLSSTCITNLSSPVLSSTLGTNQQYSIDLSPGIASLLADMDDDIDMIMGYFCAKSCAF